VFNLQAEPDRFGAHACETLLFQGSSADAMEPDAAQRAGVADVPAVD
jgi:hypothetical protein